MSNLISKKEQEEKLRRYTFLGVSGGGLLLTFAVTPILGIPVIAAGAYLGYRWFEYRVKNGMRF